MDLSLNCELNKSNFKGSSSVYLINKWSVRRQPCLQLLLVILTRVSRYLSVTREWGVIWSQGKIMD